MHTHQRFALLGVTTFLAGLAAAHPAVAASGEWTGDVNFVLGQKMLKTEDWDPVEDQGALAAEVSWGKRVWPISIATDLLGSNETTTVAGVDFEGTTSELGLGIRKIWQSGKFHVYIGGGLAQIYAKAKVSVTGFSAEDTGDGTGGWAGAGVFWRLGRRFNLGLAGRLSKATARISRTDVEVGGAFGGVTIGWGWPATS